MSKEKQIEEIRKDIFAAFGGYAKWEEDWQSLAEAVYNAGCRKQSEGEWKYLDGDVGYDIYGCSVCGESVVFYEEDKYAFCPNCGAKMKGGE